jgi:PhnB protein
MPGMPTSITPMLTVRNAAAAMTYYTRAFGAVEVERFTTPTGQIVAEMSLGGEPFYVVDENPDAFNLSPETLDGTSVRINLIVEDPDACAERAVAAGATELFPVADQPYGMRQGRVVDPYGHHWLIGRPLG